MKTHTMLTLINTIKKPGDKRGYGLYKCDCGTLKVIRKDSVENGHTRSCGCLADAVRESNRKKGWKHLMSNTPTFNSWKGMMGRCYRPTNTGYYTHGGRGIKVCEYLRLSPLNLRELLGERPKALTIERIENDGHYSCGNCKECKDNHWVLNVRWATRAEQNRNMRRNRWITINGIVKTATDWASTLGVSFSTIVRKFGGIVSP